MSKMGRSPTFTFQTPLPPQSVPPSAEVETVVPFSKSPWGVMSIPCLSACFILLCWTSESKNASVASRHVVHPATYTYDLFSKCVLGA